MTLRRALTNPAFVVSFVLLLLTAAGMSVLPRYMNVYLKKEPIESRRHMRDVSGQLPHWVQVETDRQEADDILKALGTYNTVTRYYKQRDPAPGNDPYVVELHLAYYTGMVDTVPHVADRCMLGGGWVVNTGSVVLPVTLDDSTWRRATGLPAWLPHADTLSLARLPLGENSSAPGMLVGLPADLIAADASRDHRHDNVVEMRITDFRDPKSQAVSIIGYFFIANNSLTPSANEVRQLAFRLEDDCAYYAKVQVAAVTAPTQDLRPRPVGSARELADVMGGPGGFVSEVLPEVMRCLPDWIEVEKTRRGEAGKAGAGK